MSPSVGGLIGARVLQASSVRWRWRASIAWARVAKAPLVHLGRFRNRTCADANLATFTFGMAFSMMFFAFFFYMHGIWHYSLSQAGLAITPGPLLVMPVSINKLPVDRHAVGSVVNQATRQIGSVLGVALPMLLLGHEGLTRGDFTALYGTHVTLGLLTALLCLPVATRSAKLAA